MARMICCGVTVIEFIITPNGLRVSLMAFKTAPEAPATPASPAPLAPSSEVFVGVLVWE